MDRDQPVRGAVRRSMLLGREKGGAAGQGLDRVGDMEGFALLTRSFCFLSRVLSSPGGLRALEYSSQG